MNSLQDCIILEIISYLSSLEHVKQVSARFKQVGVHCMRRRVSNNCKLKLGKEFVNEDNDSNKNENITKHFDLSTPMPQNITHEYLNELNENILSPYRLVDSDDNDDNEQKCKICEMLSKMDTCNCLCPKIVNDNKILWIDSTANNRINIIDKYNNSNYNNSNNDNRNENDNATKITISKHNKKDQITCIDWYDQDIMFYINNQVDNQLFSLQWIDIHFANCNVPNTNGKLTIDNKNLNIHSFIITDSKIFCDKDGIHENRYIIYDTNNQTQINGAKINYSCHNGIFSALTISITNETLLFKCNEDDGKISHIYKAIVNKEKEKCYIFFKTSEWDDIQYGTINLDSKSSDNMLHEFDAIDMLGLQKVDHFVLDSKRIYYCNTSQQQNHDFENDNKTDSTIATTFVSQKLSYFGL